MKLLILSSTKFEAKNIAFFLKIDISGKDNFFRTNYFNNSISLLICGIGGFQTMYNMLENIESNKYDFIINIGICGSFSKSLPIGSVVNITEEQFGDFGINNRGNYISLFSTKLIDSNLYPFENGKLLNKSFEKFIKLENIPAVSSLTVNTASGEKNQIQMLVEKFNADTENMEGAYFFYVCIKKNIPFLEIRSISNLVEPRNNENWQIMLAVKNLTDALKIIIFELIK